MAPARQVWIRDFQLLRLLLEFFSSPVNLVGSQAFFVHEDALNVDVQALTLVGCQKWPVRVNNRQDEVLVAQPAFEGKGLC